MAELDLYEVNEAFAPVPLAWLQQLEADPAKLNVHGGAIALGHPLGASGAKLMATLVPDGVITAGNASQICDGGSGVLSASERAL